MAIQVNGSGGSGTDTDAIHDNIAGEINGIAEKAAPVDADLVLIEDSEAGNVKKRVQVGNLPGGGNDDIGARVYNNANISIPNNTPTILTFNTERWDTDTMHSTIANTGRLTCVTAGKYLIVAHVEWAANATSVRHTNIFLNGSTYIGGQDAKADGSIGGVSTVAVIYDLNVDDYVEVSVYQASGGALNIVANANRSPEFSAQLLAEA